MPARARQQFYADGLPADFLAQVEACPMDEAGNFIAEKGRSDEVHRSLGPPG